MTKEVRDVPLNTAWFRRHPWDRSIYTSSVTKYRDGLTEAEVTRQIEAAQTVHVILPGGRRIAPGFDE